VALPEPLAAPTDIVALTDGRLLLADGGKVTLLDPQGDGYRASWTLEAWGTGPKERFGKRLRLAADGPWLLVSDTDRHRLVWFDWTQRKALGEFGQTDAAGDDLQHLASPAQAALQGDRAVVADAGNQRVLQLRLRP
jgi:hypothetical protein